MEDERASVASVFLAIVLATLVIIAVVTLLVCIGTHQQESQW